MQRLIKKRAEGAPGSGGSGGGKEYMGFYGRSSSCSLRLPQPPHPPGTLLFPSASPALFGQAIHLLVLDLARNLWSLVLQAFPGWSANQLHRGFFDEMSQI